MSSGSSVYCRVCGYLPPDPPWEVGGREPSFEVCSCCGVEWGYEDSSPAGVARYRSRWLAAGGVWQDKRTPHDGLDAEARMARVLHWET